MKSLVNATFLNMKKWYLLVDGYNIIFAWDNLKKIANHSIDDAREKLIYILSNYQSVADYSIIVVFDAHLVKGNFGTFQKRGNISVIFTKERETADNFIEMTTKKLAKDYFVKVATSDKLEQIIILGAGATPISAKQLKADIDFYNKKINKTLEEIKPIKNNTIFDCLTPEIATAFEKIIFDNKK